MTEETISGSVAAMYFAHIVGVMRENEEFILKNARGAYDEVIELINDAIDEVQLAVNRPDKEKDYFERSITFFTYHTLMPFSHAIYLDLLAGNVPASFMEMRLILESLAKCYLADLRYPEVGFFQTRLERLEREMEQTKLSTSKALRELGEKLGAANDFVALWGILSQDWMHTKGFIDKLVSHVTEKSDIPPWALVIPMNYTEADLSILEEMRNRISQLRSLLSTTMGKYRQEQSPEAG